MSLNRSLAVSVSVATLLSVAACGSRPAEPALADTQAPPASAAPTPAPVPTPAPAPAPARPDALAWPVPAPGFPADYAATRALLPSGFDLAHVQVLLHDHRPRAEAEAAGMTRVASADFDRDGRRDLALVMEEDPRIDDEGYAYPGRRALVVFLQRAEGKLTRDVTVFDIVKSGLGADDDPMRFSVDESGVIALAHTFGVGRESTSDDTTIAYRDGDFFVTGHGQSWNEDVEGSAEYAPVGYTADFVTGRGSFRGVNGDRRTFEIAPRRLRVRDFTGDDDLAVVVPAAPRQQVRALAAGSSSASASTAQPACYGSAVPTPTADHEPREPRRPRQHSASRNLRPLDEDGRVREVDAVLAEAPRGPARAGASRWRCGGLADVRVVVRTTKPSAPAG
ncbi:MAG: hypothetical protein U1F43_24390 [Myxococcota bacterium]